MRAGIRNPVEPRLDLGKISALVPIGFLAIGVPWGIWSVYALLGGGGSEAVEFDAAAGWFVLLAVGYLALHGLRGLGWTSIPVLLTIEASVGFVGVPAWRFASGVDQVDSGYVHAMFLVLVGFIAFWIGSLVFIKKSSLQFIPRWENTPDRVAFMSVALLGLGVMGNFVLWKAGLFSYASDPGAHASSLGFIQWLGYLADLLRAAMLVAAIEVFGKRAAGWLMKFVLCFSLLSEVGVGVLSGMKSAIVFPLVYVFLIYGITKRRIPRVALLVPVIVVVLVYPFVTAYRNNLNAGYRAQFNTIEGVEATVAQSFDDAFRGFGSTSSEAEGVNSQAATERLSYLTMVRNVIELPAPSMLNGDEKVWLAPVYPLIPRFLWKGKPVLDKGLRLAFLLGSGGGTSAALTPIGDLYAMYGAYGVVIGMCVWGASMQLYMNWIVKRGVSERSLFVCILMLPILLNLEGDVVGQVAATVQSGILAVIMAYAVYGHTARPTSAAKPRI